MKLNFKVFKKGKAIYWVIGGAIIFAIFYFMFSRGASSQSSGNMLYMPTGPSEAQLAAGLQAQSIQAQLNAAAMSQQVELEKIKAQSATDITLANIASNLSLEEIQASTDLIKYQTAKDAEIASLTLQTQERMATTSQEYALAAAQSAYATQIASKELDAAILSKQIDTNVKMLEIQSTNLIQQNLIAQVGSLKKKDRDETLQIIAGNLTGYPVSYTNPRGGPAIITGAPQNPLIAGRIY